MHAPPEADAAGAHQLASKRERGLSINRERETRASPAAGPQATDQTKREKISGQGTRTRATLHQGGDPSSVSILRWTSGHCNGNENEANGTRERASVKTDTGLYSLRDSLQEGLFQDNYFATCFDILVNPNNLPLI